MSKYLKDIELLIKQHGVNLEINSNDSLKYGPHYNQVTNTIHIPNEVQLEKIFSNSPDECILLRDIIASNELDCNLYEFSLLHELGHAIDLRYINFNKAIDYYIAIYKHKNTNYNTNEESSIAYRQLPSEKAADEFAVNKVNELMKDGCPT